uniref:Uncharacterized protein n=1 Tax=virus sp. ctBS918 TaxID=2825807 RepID=A0A8S5RNQ2_9VIRU|nr:MAG TPA: hypothetical protein [virus sp. ctBS918]
MWKNLCMSVRNQVSSASKNLYHTFLWKLFEGYCHYDT